MHGAAEAGGTCQTQILSRTCHTDTGNAEQRLDRHKSTHLAAAYLLELLELLLLPLLLLLLEEDEDDEVTPASSPRSRMRAAARARSGRSICSADSLSVPHVNPVSSTGSLCLATRSPCSRSYTWAQTRRSICSADSLCVPHMTLSAAPAACMWQPGPLVAGHTRGRKPTAQLTCPVHCQVAGVEIVHPPACLLVCSPGHQQCLLACLMK